MNQPPATQGVAGLFLPNLFQNVIPLILPNHTEFPFPDPPGNIARRLPPSLSCKPMRRAMISTARKSHTKLPLAVSSMSPNVRLQKIRRSNRLWGNLCTYADPTPGPGTLNPTHTYNPPFVYPFPDSAKQFRAIYGLWRWFIHHHNDSNDVVVTAETSVQDQVYHQLLNPVNLLLKTRYTNMIENHTMGTLWPDAFDSHILHTPADFFPQWTRSCHNHHRAGMDQKAAGFPDFILQKTPRKPSEDLPSLVVEVKTFWSHEEQITRGNGN